MNAKIHLKNFLLSRCFAKKKKGTSNSCEIKMHFQSETKEPSRRGHFTKAATERSRTVFNECPADLHAELTDR